MTQNKRIASRSWGLIVPLEWENSKEIISFVETLPLYYYILHDKDIDVEGKLKKPHYHILIDFRSSRNLSTVVNYFSHFENLQENSFERIISKKASIRYLVHLDDDLKHQYKIEEIVSNDVSYKDYLLIKRSAEDDLNLLQSINQKHLPQREKDFIENYRPILVNFTPYQRFSAFFMLKKEYRERKILLDNAKDKF